VHLRRYCDPVEIGSVAPALQAIVGAALGRDARFDAVFEREDYAAYAKAYADLEAGGGGVAAADSSRDAAAEAPPAQAAAEDPAAEIMAADRAFAARSGEVGAAQAFREFMDADGLWLIADSEPIRGAEAIYQALGGAAPSGGRLLWEPVEAWASASGDFGASWGRSRFVPDDPAKPQRAYRYMTVWRRDDEGRWRGLMDMGAAANDLLAAPAAAAAAPPAQPNSPPASR
jgi:ketosteroid isomerase-like protein